MSPKIYLLSYADGIYNERQNRITEIAEKCGQFDKALSWTRKRFLAEYDWFYKKYRHILDQERGAGYWLWKPHLIHETLKTLNDGDILVYMDAGDLLAETEGLRDMLIDLMKDKDIYLTDGAYRHGDWTKRDCFVLMKCDEEKYHNAIQMEAGISVWKKSSEAIIRSYEWRLHCLLTQVLTDAPNHCGLPNLEGFKDHRHDQSVLTNLKIKHNIPSGNALRKYIRCNQNK